MRLPYPSKLEGPARVKLRVNKNMGRGISTGSENVHKVLRRLLIYYKKKTPLNPYYNLFFIISSRLQRSAPKVLSMPNPVLKSRIIPHPEASVRCLDKALRSLVDR